MREEEEENVDRDGGGGLPAGNVTMTVNRSPAFKEGEMSPPRSNFTITERDPETRRRRTGRHNAGANDPFYG